MPRTSAGFSRWPIGDIRAATNTGKIRDQGRAPATRKQYDYETKRFFEWISDNDARMLKELVGYVPAMRYYTRAGRWPSAVDVASGPGSVNAALFSLLRLHRATTRCAAVFATKQRDAATQMLSSGE